MTKKLKIKPAERAPGNRHPSNRRAHIRIMGDVSHVCYLGFIEEWAFALSLGGVVRATGPHSVEIIAEGPSGKLKELVQKLRIERYPVRVNHINVSYSPATGSFRYFSVFFDGVSTDSVAFAQKLSFYLAPGHIWPGQHPGGVFP